MLLNEFGFENKLKLNVNRNSRPSAQTDVPTSIKISQDNHKRRTVSRGMELNRPSKYVNGNKVAKTRQC
jgi:hypothetical protein